MTPDQALREVASGKLRPLYLVLGEELYLQRQVLHAIRDAALRGGIPGLNEDQVIAQDASANQVLGFAKTLPMMSQLRWVEVRQVEHWEGKGESQRASQDFDALAAYAEDPTPSSVLVLAGAKLNARRKLVTIAKKAGFLVECDALPPRELAGWVQERVQQRGAKISQSCAELLAELVGADLSQLDDAVERLVLFVSSADAAGGKAGSKEIDETVIGECISAVKTQTVWELIGALAKRDLAGTLGALHDVFEPSDGGLRLLGLIGWSTRQLVRFRAARDGGMDPGEAAKAAGAPPFKARELDAQSARLGTRELERWLTVLANVDVALKGGSRRPARAVLEEALIRLCTGQ